MAYLIWMVLWFGCQRLMMLLHLVAHNSIFETLMLTVVGLVACFIGRANLFLTVIYFIWVISWAIGCFKTGGIIAGIMVLVFQISLYVVATRKDMKGKKS